MSSKAQPQMASSAGRDWLLAVIALGCLVAALYAGVLVRLVQNWWIDPNYGHGFIVPVFAGYVVWARRKHWLNLPLAPDSLGLPVMVVGLLLLAAGTLGAELFVSRFSLLVLVTGMILYLAGRNLLRAWAFPLAFLVFMIPLPAIVLNEIMFPLQLIASRLAATCLEFLRVPVLREGNMLVLPENTLEVVEACSGIRSLISLLALSVAYTYVYERRWSVRAVLAVLMVPISIACNALRVLLAGVLTYFVGPEAAEGVFHSFSGWLIFTASLALMLLAHWLIRLVWPDRKAAHA